MLQQYIDAFQRCYPQKTVRVKPADMRRGGSMSFWVYINGDKGDRPLTTAELESATRNMRGNGSERPLKPFRQPLEKIARFA